MNKKYRNFAIIAGIVLAGGIASYLMFNSKEDEDYNTPRKNPYV